MADEQFETLRGMLTDVLQRLERLERQRLPPEPMPADDLVDADYFARATGLKPASIVRGKAGTSRVPLASKRPRRWYKRDVDKFQRERVAAARPARQKAFQLLERKRA